MVHFVVHLLSNLLFHDDFLELIKQGKIELNPEYQRGVCFSD